VEDRHPPAAALTAKKTLRKFVQHLEEDHPLYPDHNARMEKVKKRDIQPAVEEAIGELKT
jgi:hypothetical protein